MVEELTYKCYSCLVDKPYIEFNKSSVTKEGIKHKCRDCSKLYYKTWAENNPKKYQKNLINQKTRCKSELYKKRAKEKSKLWSLDKKEYIASYQKEYRKANIDKIREVKKVYKQKRKKEDSLYKLKFILGSRIRQALKRKGCVKTSKTRIMIGADYDVVRKHIERQFKKGMTWDNNTTNGWHIDHIIPLDTAKTEEELISLCHYTNLQPMWAKDNLKKSKYINGSGVQIKITI